MGQNKVTLLGFYGGDDRHCLSAWQSTSVEVGIELSPDIQQRIKQLFEETVVTKKKTPQELLSFLAEHGHTSPFRKSHLDFQVTADIATHIHCLKHRYGVEINSESARYKELKSKWYLPDDWDHPVTKNYDRPELIPFHGYSWAEALNQYVEMGHSLYHEAIAQLAPVLGRARAKESARYFLPYAKQIDFDMQFSFQAFVHFQNLRNSDHAQKEVKELAQEMLELVRAIEGNPFQYSLNAFGY